NSLTLAQRLAGPTPKLFQIIRYVGVVLAGISGMLMTLQAEGAVLPEWLIFLADKAYLLAGAIATLISSLTVDMEAFKKKNALK
ncbi:hypothetical protein, partial [Arsenicibacter rosenii]